MKIHLVDREELRTANELRDEVRKLHSMNAALYQEQARLRAENDQLRQQGGDATLKSELDRLRAENEALRANFRANDGPTSDNALREVKRRFAKMYHPNDASRSSIEGLVRAEIFKEFWQVLEEIEGKYRSS